MLPNMLFCAAAAAKSLQSCPTLCDPIPGILQARTMEWVAISFSNAWKWKVKVKSLSRVRLLVTPWTTAHQAPPSIGFSRQEYWSGVPLPSPVYPLMHVKWVRVRVCCLLGLWCWISCQGPFSAWLISVSYFRPNSNVLAPKPHCFTASHFVRIMFSLLFAL